VWGRGQKKVKNMSWHNIHIRPTDAYFSKALRKKRGYRCEKCGRFYSEGKGLSVSHFYGRRNENVRFDEDNCDILDYCHQKFEENPNEYRDWKFEKLGKKKFDALKLKANFYCKRDDKLMMLYLKKTYGKN